VGFREQHHVIALLLHPSEEGFPLGGLSKPIDVVSYYAEGPEAMGTCVRH
jgi:hypothetical protein